MDVNDSTEKNVQRRSHIYQKHSSQLFKLYPINMIKTKCFGYETAS